MKDTNSNKSKSLTIEGRLKLYATLGDNLIAYKVQLDYLFYKSKNNPKNYYIRLFRNITFIALDLCVALRACLISKNKYENRYHIKYLLVNIYEAVRAIYNKENDKYSYLSKLQRIDTQLLNNDSYCNIINKIQLLQSEFACISNARNSYVHYDENVLDTYNHLVDIKSEEYATQWCCELLYVLQYIKNLCESKFTVEISEIMVSPSCDYNAMIVQSIHDKISNDENLKGAIKSTINRAIKDLDAHARYLKLVNLLDLDVAAKVCPFLNIYMLIQILRADIAVAVKAFLQSQDNVESMMNLRRIAIIKYEGLSHLQCMWQKLPNSLVYDKEDEWINTITSGEKKDERNQSTHYRYRGNDYISKMYIECRDSMNHLKILKEIPSLLNVLTSLSNKLKDRLKIFQKTNMYPMPPMCS